MNEALDCARSEELLSDRLAGALDATTAAALDRHLGLCERCRALAEAVGEVVDALQSFPAVEPAADLAERAATAALASRRRSLGRSWGAFRLPDLGLPVGLQVLAASIALVVTGGAVLAATQSSRLREQTFNAGAYLSERKDRVFEDFRLLRVVVTTAFEGRLDRMNDRVDDYRRLLEKRRAVEQQQKQTSEPKSDAGSVRSARHAQFPPGWWNSNNAGTAVVTASERGQYRSGRRARRES
jgi:Putative zinc-finger